MSAPIWHPERLQHPVKVYCLWCDAETYDLHMICGRCAHRSEADWLWNDVC